MATQKEIPDRNKGHVEELAKEAEDALRRLGKTALAGGEIRGHMSNDLIRRITDYYRTVQLLTEEPLAPEELSEKAEKTLEAYVQIRQLRRDFPLLDRETLWAEER